MKLAQLRYLVAIVEAGFSIWRRRRSCTSRSRV